MSSRQLRKLQKQKELEALQAQNPAEDSEESEDDAPIQKPKASIFSGFAALGDQDEQEEDQDDEEEPADSATAPADAPQHIDTPKSSSKKSKKKKKKAKKAAEPAPTRTTAAGKDASDEIDQAIRELSLSKKSGSTDAAEDTAVAKAYERICELLRVNTHHLKVINEMRNLFGREAITAAEMEEDEDRARTQRSRQPLQQQVDLETFLKGQPGKKLPDVTLRRNPFLPGKDTWPRASTEGLTMKQVKDGTVTDKAGTVEFGFAHDEGYNTLEKQFFALVQMYDPMQLVHFLHRHPYHISSLIQVSKVAKQDQNSALCGDLCERALFTFGRVSLSAFRQKLEEGKARLEFRRPENRQFWLAGYHYLKSLVMKGTYRTALEWSKLLFSMDLSDPYALVHFIHPLAIRAHESKWFIDFCDSEILDECEPHAQDYIRQTLVLARLQQKDTTGAKALLIEGMERVPWLYSSLFKALNQDVPKAIWGMQPRDGHEELYTELYVHQTKSLWDNAQAMSLLKEAGNIAKKPDFKDFADPPVVGRNLGRFIYLDNTPALMGLVPGGLLSTSPNWEFDPLPPKLEENVFSYESQKFPWNPDRPPTGAGLPTDREALRRIFEQARREGAPQDVQHLIEEALDDGDDMEALRGDDRDSPPPIGAVGMGGILQAFVDLVRRHQGVSASDFHPDLMDRMPGAWADESGEGSNDDDMPGLIPPDGNNDANESTDDEMPPLERPS